MPRKHELTWDKASKRWKKYYKGKQYYFRHGESKTDAAGYLKALNAWQDRKREIDNASTESPHIRKWDEFIAEAMVQQRQCERNDTPKNRERWLYLAGLIGTYKHLKDEGVDWFGDLSESALPIIGIDRDELESPPPWQEYNPGVEISPQRTIEGNVERFMSQKKQQVERKEQSHGHFDLLRCCLANFTKYVGGSRAIETINGGMLESYRDYLLQRIEGKVKGEQCSPEYGKSHLNSVRQFVRWCWERELLELPRVLSSREFKIVVPEKRIELLTKEEIERLLVKAEGATKLYILLMLNCGMTQQDVADLKQTEVDWKRGRVIRKRSKTEKHKNVPEVEYVLWEETFKLLQQNRSKDETLALTNRNGSPLKVEEIVNGKVKKNDNVKNAYFRLCKKANVTKPLKLLRKTAASKLAEHSEFGKFAQHFLGHSPQTIADKHYIRPSQEQFDNALIWLEKCFLKAESIAKESKIPVDDDAAA